ncbi:MAG: hypothetical protein ABJB95_08345 [Gemmatimonadales bacterium]
METVREIVRRAGHEIRNALNGVAVNVEVVRSRSSREAPAQELTSFAERAVAQVGEVSAIADGLLAFTNAVLAAMAHGTLKEAGGRGAGSRIELTIYGDRAAGVVSEIERLASRVGVAVEEHGQSVILSILPEGKSHPKA